MLEKVLINRNELLREVDCGFYALDRMVADGVIRVAARSENRQTHFYPSAIDLVEDFLRQKQTISRNAPNFQA